MSTAAVLIDPWEAVRGVNGPAIALPFRLLQITKDAQAAVMLHQGVYISSLCRDRDGWFSLSQVGDADLESESLFSRMGSWEALGCGGPDRQRTLRRKLEDLGLLQTKLRGQPGRLHYRFSPEIYMQLIARAGNGSSDSGNPVSRLDEDFDSPDSLSLVSGNPEACSDLTGNQFRETRNLGSGSPPTSDIDTHADKHIDQNTHRFKPDESHTTAPVSTSVDIGPHLDQLVTKQRWSPRLKEAVLIHLQQLRLIGGGQLTRHDWDQVFKQLAFASNPLRWLMRVSNTGWDPRSLSSLARPGESVDQAILRVSRERDLNTSRGVG